MGAWATAVAVAVAGLAVWSSNRAASQDRALTERLVGIEQRRDQPRLQVLDNFYSDVFSSPATGPVVGSGSAQITVANIGSVIAGPVSVGICDVGGTSVSTQDVDPKFIEPGKRATFTVGVSRAFETDPDRRGATDAPMQPVKLRRGYFARAWDELGRNNWWFPGRPPRACPGKPSVT